MDKTFDDDEFLWSQFIRLGEMLGDGDCDAWVGKEYKQIAIQLGLIKRKPRKNNSEWTDSNSDDVDFFFKIIGNIALNLLNTKTSPTDNLNILG